MVHPPLWHGGIALKHAVTLVHEYWTVDIDIQHHIPGVALPPGGVFDALWARRDHVDLANWRVNVPDRTDHALILILNILRSGPNGVSDTRLNIVASALDDAEMRTLDRRIADLDCGPEVAPFARQYGRGLITPDNRAPTRTWLLYQHLDQPALLWMDGLSRAPWKRKPALLLNALLPSRLVLSERNLALIEARPRKLFYERFNRLARTSREVPKLLSSYRRIRRLSSSQETHGAGDGSQARG